MAYQLLITVLVTLAAIAVIRFENSGKASPRRRQYTGKTAQHSHFSGNSFGVPFVNATYDYVYFTPLAWNPDSMLIHHLKRHWRWYCRPSCCMEARDRLVGIGRCC